MVSIKLIVKDNEIYYAILQPLKFEDVKKVYDNIRDGETQSKNIEAIQHQTHLSRAVVHGSILLLRSVKGVTAEKGKKGALLLHKNNINLKSEYDAYAFSHTHLNFSMEVKS